jgi:hypothetical protein
MIWSIHAIAHAGDSPSSLDLAFFRPVVLPVQSGSTSLKIERFAPYTVFIYGFLQPKTGGTSDLITRRTDQVRSVNR